MKWVERKLDKVARRWVVRDGGKTEQDAAKRAEGRLHSRKHAEDLVRDRRKRRGKAKGKKRKERP